MKIIFITFLVLGSLYCFFSKKEDMNQDEPKCQIVVALETHLEQLEEMEERIKNAQLKLDELWFDPSQKQELQKTFVGSIRMNINLGKQFLSKGSKDSSEWINSRRVMLDCSQWAENSEERQKWSNLVDVYVKGISVRRDRITRALAHEQKKQVSTKQTVG
jgi:TolA-binding protein